MGDVAVNVESNAVTRSTSPTRASVKLPCSLYVPAVKSTVPGPLDAKVKVTAAGAGIARAERDVVRVGDAAAGPDGVVDDRAGRLRVRGGGHQGEDDEDRYAERERGRA